MSWMQYMLPLLLSCFTGWFVIWITPKLLFRPYNPISIAGFKIQGIIPANQQHVAEKIGLLVSEQLFSFAALQDKVTDPENFNKLKPEIESHIDSFLRVRLKDTFPMLSMLIGDKTINQLKTAFLLELESLFPVIMTNYLTQLEKDIDIKKQVTEKIAGFSISKMEGLVYRSANKQLIKLQLFGAVIGLLMGLIHIFINMQLYR
jgi:uncharacterized membrane protein YheB (UPF0754 family)